MVACGSKPSESSETAQETKGGDNWQDFTKDNIAGNWEVISFESEVDDTQALKNKEFNFNGDTLKLTYFFKGTKAETKSCFYELTQEGTIKITVPMENGEKWIEFSGGIDNGDLSLNHNGKFIKLKKAN